MLHSSLWEKYDSIAQNSTVVKMRSVKQEKAALTVFANHQPAKTHFESPIISSLNI